MKTATYIKDLERFTGEAKLYELSEEIKLYDWNDKLKGTTKFVVVSATNVLFSGFETYIFPANEDGNVTDWGELSGSYRGGLDHDVALNGLGFKPVYKEIEQ